MEIGEILKKYETDKNSGHHYGEPYRQIFSQFDKTAKLDILEIGTQKGGSLLAWKEYFPNANITGIDIKDQVLDKYKRSDINYIVCDVNDYRTDQMFDVVIDDGSHWLKDVVHTVAYFSKRLKLGGKLVVEDVQDPSWIPVLYNILSPNLEYNSGEVYKLEHFDLREIENKYDDQLLVIERLDKWK